jgi:hypothetical protein
MGTGTNGVGIWDGGGGVNVDDDDDLYTQASYRVLHGTVDEDRWPSIDLRLHGTPDLIPAYPDLAYGSRVQFLNPPAQVAPESIDCIIEGRADRIDTKSWSSTVNTTPFSPYRTFRLSGGSPDPDEFLGYLTPTTWVLAAAVDTTQATITTTATTALLSTTSADWSRGVKIVIDGEVMTLTDVSGGSNPQTLTVTRSVNSIVKEHAAGVAVAFLYPGNLGL